MLALGFYVRHVVSIESQNLQNEYNAIKVKRIENLIDQNVWAPVWVVDFPLVDWNEDENRFDALHHPFTSPKDDKIHSSLCDFIKPFVYCQGARYVKFTKRLSTTY